MHERLVADGLAAPIVATDQIEAPSQPPASAALDGFLWQRVEETLGLDPPRRPIFDALVFEFIENSIGTVIDQGFDDRDPSLAADHILRDSVFEFVDELRRLSEDDDAETDADGPDHAGTVSDHVGKAQRLVAAFTHRRPRAMRYRDALLERLRQRLYWAAASRQRRFGATYTQSHPMAIELVADHLEYLARLL